MTKFHSETAGKLYITNIKGSSLEALSTKAPYSFTIDEKLWPTVYHFVSAHMFDGKEEEVRTMSLSDVELLTTPQTIITGDNYEEVYGKNKYKLKDDWLTLRREFLLLANREKIAQNPSVKLILLSTMPHELVDEKDPDNGPILEVIRYNIRGHSYERITKVVNINSLKVLIPEDMKIDPNIPKKMYRKTYNKIINKIGVLVQEIMDEEEAYDIYLGVMEDAIYSLHYDTKSAFEFITSVRPIASSPLILTYMKDKLPVLNGLYNFIVKKFTDLLELWRTKYAYEITVHKEKAVLWSSYVLLALYIKHVLAEPKDIQNKILHRLELEISPRFMPEKRPYRYHYPDREYRYNSAADIIIKQQELDDETHKNESVSNIGNSDTESSESDKNDANDITLKENVKYIITKTSSKYTKDISAYADKLKKLGAVYETHTDTVQKGLKLKNVKREYFVFDENADKKKIDKLLAKTNYSTVKISSYSILGNIKDYAQQLYAMGARFKTRKGTYKKVLIVEASPGNLDFLASGGYYDENKHRYIFLYDKELEDKLGGKSEATTVNFKIQPIYNGIAVIDKNTEMIVAEDYVQNVKKFISDLGKSIPHFMREWLSNRINFAHDLCVIFSKLQKEDKINYGVIYFVFELTKCPAQMSPAPKHIPEDMLQFEDFKNKLSKAYFRKLISKICLLMEIYLHQFDSDQEKIDALKKVSKLTVKGSRKENSILASVYLYEKSTEFGYLQTGDVTTFAQILNSLTVNDKWTKFQQKNKFENFNISKRDLSSIRSFIGSKTSAKFTDENCLKLLAQFSTFIVNNPEYPVSKINYFANFKN